MKFEIAGSDFTPHPDGMHSGTIVDVVDHGLRESTFEGRTREVHKLAIVIESESAMMDDGRPFVHHEWCTLSSNDRSKLVKLRQGLLKRPLAKQEKLDFDASKEMIGRKVHYLIELSYRNGKTYANIASWSLQDSNSAAPSASPAGDSGGIDDSAAASVATAAAEGDAPTKEDLPF
jgi:hypothetical protein